jgi:hypothetical protein
VLSLLLATALAGPFQTLHSSDTVDAQGSEMGGGLGYAFVPQSPEIGVALFSGWARYGLSDRAEAFGGAVGGTAGYGLVAHGGVRYRLGADTGPQASGGVGLLSSLGPGLPVAFQAPVMVGIAGNVDVFAGGTVIAAPLGQVGTLLTTEAEAGVGFEVESFPVYVAGTYRSFLGAPIVGLSIGMGYDLAQ